MKPYDEEFGSVDVPREARCPSCNSSITAFGTNIEGWFIYCGTCGRKGEEGESMAEAIDIWNKIKREYK